jgi:hypothetical protein
VTRRRRRGVSNRVIRPAGGCFIERPVDMPATLLSTTLSEVLCGLYLVLEMRCLNLVHKQFELLVGILCSPARV